MILRRFPDAKQLWLRIVNAGYPTVVVGGSCIGGNQYAWTRAFPGLPGAHLQDVEDQLPAIEARVARDREFERRHEAECQRDRENLTEDRRRYRQQIVDALRAEFED
jgi:hypothetical protein